MQHFAEQPAASNIILQNNTIGKAQLMEPPTAKFKVIYEVFRIDGGTPLFIDEHLNRLYAGAMQAGHAITVSRLMLEHKLAELVKVSGAINGNVKVEFFFAPDETGERYYRAFFIPTRYPTPEMYAKGVSCALLERGRESPSIKVANNELRSHSDNIITEMGVYETVLHHDGVITEGSRSNIFFIKGGMLYTAPGGMVLEGIIRGKVIELAEQLSIPIKFLPLPIEEIHTVEAAFLTGTSPRVLPVNKLGDKPYPVPHRLSTLLAEHLGNLIAKLHKGSD